MKIFSIFIFPLIKDIFSSRILIPDSNKIKNFYNGLNY